MPSFPTFRSGQRTKKPHRFLLLFDESADKSCVGLTNHRNPPSVLTYSPLRATRPGFDASRLPQCKKCSVSQSLGIYAGIFLLYVKERFVLYHFRFAFRAFFVPLYTMPIFVFFPFVSLFRRTIFGGVVANLIPSLGSIRNPYRLRCCSTSRANSDKRCKSSPPTSRLCASRILEMASCSAAIAK